MKSERKPFQPLSADLDERIESLARDKGIGVLVKPSQGEQGATPEEPTSPSPGATTPRSRMKAVTLELPDYVWTELKILAARRQTSVRHIVMTALRKDGITIAEADMVEDGRRLRGSARGNSHLQ